MMNKKNALKIDESKHNDFLNLKLVEKNHHIAHICNLHLYYVFLLLKNKINETDITTKISLFLLL